MGEGMRTVWELNELNGLNELNQLHGLQRYMAGWKGKFRPGVPYRIERRKVMPKIWRSASVPGRSVSHSKTGGDLVQALSCASCRGGPRRAALRPHKTERLTQ